MSLGGVGPSIVVDDAHVTYRVYESSALRLQDVLLKRSLRRRARRQIPALRGIDLVVSEGESVAVLGPNGSGKSTLLRVIAGLQPLDRGTLKVASRPRLLGVQAMLKGTWTGRQSIETGLIAMGVRRQEAVDRTTGVAAFARLQDVIDLPTSTYSAGMRARLYFSISTEVGGDILLIDEALAAGDAAFRRAAKARLSDRLAQSKTLVLVSHSMSTVQELCDRAVLVADGRIVEDGEPERVIRKYNAL